MGNILNAIKFKRAVRRYDEGEIGTEALVDAFAPLLVPLLIPLARMLVGVVRNIAESTEVEWDDELVEQFSKLLEEVMEIAHSATS